MHAYNWYVDVTQILSRSEIAQVLTDLKARSHLTNVWMNLAVFRLATCCGLRTSEIGELRLRDVRVGIPRLHLVVRPQTAKGGRGRRLPLWWDEGTLRDLEAWKAERVGRGAKLAEPLVCSLQKATFGQPLNRHVLRRRFHTACRVLGWERLRTLTIHHGRDSFVSHALAVGRTLAEVR